MKITEIENVICKRLGHPGRMIGGSKSGYMQNNKDNVVVFNANIIIELKTILKTKYTKVWYGDIDITKDENILNEIAQVTGSMIYVLREYDNRFDTESKPNISNYVVKTNGMLVIGPNWEDWYTRNDAAKLIQKS